MKMMRNSSVLLGKLCKWDADEDVMEDVMVLGAMATATFYVVLKMANVIGGIDGFLHSLTSWQVAGVIATTLVVALLMELYVRCVYRRKSGLVLSRFLLGGLLLFIAYTLAIATGGTAGYDEKIRLMTAWDFHIFMCIEFMYFSFIRMVAEGMKRSRK